MHCYHVVAATVAVLQDGDGMRCCVERGVVSLSLSLSHDATRALRASRAKRRQQHDTTEGSSTTATPLSCVQNGAHSLECSTAAQAIANAALGTASNPAPRAFGARCCCCSSSNACMAPKAAPDMQHRCDAIAGHRCDGPDLQVEQREGQQREGQQTARCCCIQRGGTDDCLGSPKTVVAKI
jgi:hypothetical protein